MSLKKTYLFQMVRSRIASTVCFLCFHFEKVVINLAVQVLLGIVVHVDYWKHVLTHLAPGGYVGYLYLF